MSSEENKALIRRYFDEVLRSGDKAAIDEIVASRALKDQLARNRAAFDRFYENAVIEDVIAEGDKVVVRITTRGTHRGEVRGVAPTGKEVTVSGVGIYRLSGGKIVEHWTYSDMLQKLLAAEAQPAQAG